MSLARLFGGGKKGRHIANAAKKRGNKSIFGSRRAARRARRSGMTTPY